MKKTLLTILGILALGIPVLSQESDSAEIKKKAILEKLSEKRVFNKEDFNSYPTDYYISKDKKYLVVDYDLDNNGNSDIKAYFPYVGETKLNNQTIYLTLSHALTIFVDENKDSEPDIVYLNKDNDQKGIFEWKMTYEKYQEYIDFLKKKKESKDKLLL
jgi:hypothetical protein